MPRWSFVVTLTIAIGAPPALAQSPATFGKDGAPLSSLDVGGQLSQALIDRDGLAAGSKGGDSTVSTVTSGTSGVARALAATYPADRRAGAEQMFRDLLAGYARVETAFGLPAGDLAGATALFVIGSFEAFRGTAVDPAAYRPVIAQMRGAIQASAAFGKAGAPARREAYEQLAILGMFVTAVRLELEKHPDEKIARELRTAAGTYLSQFLGTDPDKVEISTAGVAIGAASAPPAAASAPGASAPAASAPATAPARSPALDATATIETVGFYTVHRWNDGFMLQLPTPIVLFKSGDALLEMDNLNDPAGLEANRRSRPQDWTKWRRVGRTIQRRDGDEWRKLEWTRTNDRLPRGFKLDRSYQSFSGGGGTFAGSTTSTASWRNVRFDRSGRFSTDGGAGATTGGVTARSQSATAGGTYEIAGYTLTLRHSDGRTVHRSIVADQKNPKVIWIDGTSYTSD
jgi:hypothetical protein